MLYDINFPNSNPNTLTVLDTYNLEADIRCALCTNPNRSLDGCDGACKFNAEQYTAIITELKNRSTSLSHFAVNSIALNNNVANRCAGTGTWMPVNVSSRGLAHNFRCSACGEVVHSMYKREFCDYAFCPKCGAKMFSRVSNSNKKG